jgi:hypothetical protein
MCFFSCLLQLVTSSSPIVFSSFFLESIAFFSLFFWLLQVSSSFFFGYWFSLFFHRALTCFLVFSYRVFFLEVLRWFIVFLLQVLIVVIGGGFHTCVFFVAHGLPRLIFGSLCCSCVLSMLFKYFQCCLCVVQALIMCVVGASMTCWCWTWKETRKWEKKNNSKIFLRAFKKVQGQGNKCIKWHQRIFNNFDIKISSILQRGSPEYIRWKN